MYGGTKAEMERLLKDAEKLSGVKYDLSSYADIVDAIHVIQGEMQISGRTAEEAAEIYERTGRVVSEQLGTTAKEAATTITGSLNAVKGAWANLVVSIADEDQSFEENLYSLVDSVSVAADNIVPRIEVALQGVGKLVEGLAPIIGEALPGIVASTLPSLLSAGVALIAGLANGMISAAPKIAETALDVVGKLTDGIISGVPVFLESVPVLVTNFLNFITEKFPLVIEKGVDFISKLAFGIIEGLPKFVERLPDVINAFAGFITSNFPVIIQKGGELVGQLLVGVIGAIPEIALKIPAIITALVDAFKAGYEKLKNVGKYLLEGLWAGIRDKIDWLKGKVNGAIGTIKGWFTGKKGFDVHSPSKWSEQVFKYVMDGGAIGIKTGEGGLVKSAESAIDRVKSSMSASTASVDFEDSGLSRTMRPGGGGASNDERTIILNITESIDGQKLSHRQYKYNTREGILRGAPLVEGVMG